MMNSKSNHRSLILLTIPSLFLVWYLLIFFAIQIGKILSSIAAFALLISTTGKSGSSSPMFSPENAYDAIVVKTEVRGSEDNPSDDLIVSAFTLSAASAEYLYICRPHYASIVGNYSACFIQQNDFSQEQKIRVSLEAKYFLGCDELHMLGGHPREIYIGFGSLPSSRPQPSLDLDNTCVVDVDTLSRIEKDALINICSQILNGTYKGKIQRWDALPSWIRDREEAKALLLSSYGSESSKDLFYENPLSVIETLPGRYRMFANTADGVQVESEVSPEGTGYVTVNGEQIGDLNVEEGKVTINIAQETNVDESATIVTNIKEEKEDGESPTEKILLAILIAVLVKFASTPFEPILKAVGEAAGIWFVFKVCNKPKSQNAEELCKQLLKSLKHEEEKPSGKDALSIGIFIPNYHLVPIMSDETKRRYLIRKYPGIYGDSERK